VSIPDEAVEAAHKAFLAPAVGGTARDHMRRALEAAAPHLMAKALREAAADTRARGDVGKDGGIEAWTYLEWRASKAAGK